MDVLIKQLSLLGCGWDIEDFPLTRSFYAQFPKDLQDGLQEALGCLSEDPEDLQQHLLLRCLGNHEKALRAPQLYLSRWLRDHLVPKVRGLARDAIPAQGKSFQSVLPLVATTDPLKPTLLHLRFEEGLSYQEIGRRLQMDPRDVSQELRNLYQRMSSDSIV